MSKWLIRFGFLICLSCVPSSAFTQESPSEVTSCELAKNPKEFDKKPIQVRGTLNVSFEDFTLDIANCVTNQRIWLAFGGDVPGIVASTANDTFRRPGSDITVDGTRYEIRKDENFHKLYALITARRGNKPEYSVTATLTGVFFAGNESKTAQGTVNYVGYGHLACCSLLVITQASDVESDPPANLGLRGVVIGPTGIPVRGLTVIDDVLGGSPPERQTAVTGQQGELAFSTRASSSESRLRFIVPWLSPSSRETLRCN